MTVTRRHPWNRAAHACWSASTTGERPNMHLCTYVSAVSMQPRRMAVALFKGTLSLENATRSGVMVLQLLGEHHADLVDLLGRRSGHNVDKVARLRARDRVETWKGHPVLRDALAWVHLAVAGTLDAGDHVLHVGTVTAWRNVQDGEPLTTAMLRGQGIIRA